MTDTAADPRESGFGDRLPESLQRAIPQGKCVLFVGSALHVHPPEKYEELYSYPEKYRVPIGDGLSEMIAKKFKFKKEMPGESTSNLMRVSMHAETQPFGRKKLVDFLDEVLRGPEESRKQPSDAVRMLAALPFQVFVTTNYDLLLDQALREAGKTPHTLVYNPERNAKTEDIDEDELSEKTPLVFKMHGDLDHRESIVITDEDYIKFVSRMAERPNTHPVPEIVRTLMQQWPTIFVGYSLKDYNLRLFFQMIRAPFDASSIQEAYAVDIDPDLLIKRVWEDKKGLVAFLVEDIWDWVPEVYKFVYKKPYERPQQP